MPALSAYRHDDNARKFREWLTSRVKAKMQANVAIMRKYLTGLWVVCCQRHAFNSDKLFNFDKKSLEH